MSGNISHRDIYTNQNYSREKTSDRLVWNSFKEGSRTTFQYIYDQNFERLLNYGLNICSDQSLVEDQIQELFIYLWKKKENLDIKISITTYLIWCLRNRLIKTLRLSKGITLDETLDVIDKNPFQDQADNSEKLKSAVDALPPKQREVIYLKYYQNLGGEEISKIMNITIGTAYNLLSRAISNLRKTIQALIIFSPLFG
ncbi:sigma-70 family RNA polymerase sigma factor [Fulvivirgaceae bacterium BMA10]|uniref:Sigma-70 family RNA polymerase sigma factor n=1 Tax=Splendidivirga corallicola TaxID=3051826 RepID=A0ABT8KMA2_9BACT|nr:sigma-70 family RNA polymerase sigma factor [Fulvivirgaceae bacterium BMA10]